MAYSFYISPESYTIAESNGISYGTLNYRVRNLAWGTEKAITTKPQMRHKYGRWRKVAKDNGICEKTLQSRVEILKWDIERAATEKPATIKENCKRMGENNRAYPKSFIKIGLSNGISQDAFRARVRRGMSLEDACTVK